MQQANSHTQYQTRTGAAILFALFLLVVVFSFLLSSSTTERAFRRGDDRLMQLFDSGVYLNTARTILKVKAQSKSAGTSNLEKELAGMLMLDGPVFPNLAAKAMQIGKAFRLTELHALSLFESALQALLSALIFIFCWRVTGSKLLAFAGGFSWALYPPAVIATQKLATESLCAALLLTVLICFDIALSSHGKKHQHLLPLIYAGIFFAFLLLTKPVLMFSVLLSLIFVLFYLRGKTALTGLLAFGCATAISMLPFWIYTQQITGQICVFPKRMPILNAIVCNNLLNDGLGCLPPTPVSPAIAAMQSVASVEVAMFMEDPLAHADLNIRKLPRLFAEPWNDFRRAAILPNALSIRLAHQLLGAFALAAVALAFAATMKAFQRSADPDAEDTFKRTASTVSLLFLALCGHLVYTAFEGIPRYGFTAVPLLLIICFWCIDSFTRSSMSKLKILNLCAPAILLTLLSNFGRLENVLNLIGSPILAGSILITGYILLAVWLTIAFIATARVSFPSIDARLLTTTGVLFFIAFSITASLAVLKETKDSDLRATLSGAVLATREIDLTSIVSKDPASRPDWALLLIDSDKGVAKSHITVNGHKIRETPKSVYHFYQKKFDLLAFLEELAIDVKTPIEDVRQWRAVPIPTDFLNVNGKNKITLSGPATQSLNIYGDYSEIAGSTSPTYEYICHSRIFVDAASLDWRPKIKFLTEVPSQSFIESDEPKYPAPPNPDLSSAPGVQKGRLRMLLAVATTDGTSNSDQSFKSESKTVALSSLNFQDTYSNQIQTDNANAPDAVKFCSSCRADYKLNAQKQATHLVIEMRGKALSEDGDGKQAVLTVSLHGAKNEPPAGTRDGAYYDSKGQPKPESIRFPSAMQMLKLNKSEPAAISVSAIYPLDAVKGRGDSLAIEFMPIPEGTHIKLTEAEISVREMAWPDLGRGTVTVY